MPRIDSNTSPRKEALAITCIEVEGYKSIATKQSLEIRPLTILAGANSSGKSSVMQPILLLKQTLAEGSDPGAILLDGPNVKFTSAKQLLCRCKSSVCKNGFSVGVGISSGAKVVTQYVNADAGFRIERMIHATAGKPETVLREPMTDEEVRAHVPSEYMKMFSKADLDSQWRVVRTRCFLDIAMVVDDAGIIRMSVTPIAEVASLIERIIHLPGLRGNPEPTYPVRAVSGTFPGLFQDYVASVIDKWQAKKSTLLSALKADLKTLGLTWTVEARHVSDTRVELRVGRLARAVAGGAHDVVSIGDAGLGVSQALPVLVALHAARPGQMVYIEQPEIHLHPKAQVALAGVLAKAAMRGVRVVAETHSALLLLAIQTLVATRELRPEQVKLHWFERDPDGCTQVSSADLDDFGSFTQKWPEDFGEAELAIQQKYLDAVAARHEKGSGDDTTVEAPGH